MSSLFLIAANYLLFLWQRPDDPFLHTYMNKNTYTYTRYFVNLIYAANVLTSGVEQKSGAS